VTTHAAQPACHQARRRRGALGSPALTVALRRTQTDAQGPSASHQRHPRRRPASTRYRRGLVESMGRARGVRRGTHTPTHLGYHVHGLPWSSRGPVVYRVAVNRMGGQGRGNHAQKGRCDPGAANHAQKCDPGAAILLGEHTAEVSGLAPLHTHDRIPLAREVLRGPTHHGRELVRCDLIPAHVERLGDTDPMLRFREVVATRLRGWAPHDELACGDKHEVHLGRVGERLTLGQCPSRRCCFIALPVLFSGPQFGLDELQVCDAELLKRDRDQLAVCLLQPRFVVLDFDELGLDGELAGSVAPFPGGRGRACLGLRGSGPCAGRRNCSRGTALPATPRETQRHQGYEHDHAAPGTISGIPCGHTSSSLQYGYPTQTC
jgi:hypothetical protein